MHYRMKIFFSTLNRYFSHWSISIRFATVRTHNARHLGGSALIFGMRHPSKCLWCGKQSTSVA